MGKEMVPHDILEGEIIISLNLVRKEIMNARFKKWIDERSILQRKWF